MAGPPVREDTGWAVASSLAAARLGAGHETSTGCHRHIDHVRGLFQGQKMGRYYPKPTIAGYSEHKGRGGWYRDSQRGRYILQGVGERDCGHTLQRDCNIHSQPCQCRDRDTLGFRFSNEMVLD